MSAWKQIIISAAVVGLIGVLWFSFFPGAREIVERQAIYQALTSGTKAPETSPAETPSGRGGRGARVTTVVVKPVVEETINTRVSALGTGMALHSVTVLPRASGRLTEILVQAGQEVKVGDVLAHLDASGQAIAYDRAQLAVDDARATLVRTEALARSKSISETQLQQAQLALGNAELSLRSAQVDLQNRRIVAPISGSLGLLQVTVGNEITASSMIGTIEDDSAILVNFWLPEVLVGDVRVGDLAAAVPVARPDVLLEATVVGIDNKVDAASGTFEVQARLENPGRSLRAGMTFSMTMKFRGETYLAVDPLSILWGAEGAYVWRLAEDTVERQMIKVVQRNSETVLVSGDLAVGDLIVTEGLEGLMPGTKVRVFDQRGAAATGRVDAPPRSGPAKAGAAQAATASGN